MAYREPGITVIQQLQLEAVNIAGAPQLLTLVGELYEIFSDQVCAQPYDATTNMGPQTLAWPGKKTTSVVDLAGVRKSIAQMDSQLAESADYPLSWSLRDPVTGRVTPLDPYTDVEALNQTGFRIVSSASAALARIQSADVSWAQPRQIYRENGGFVAASVSVGDRVRVSNGTVVIHGTVALAYDNTLTVTPDGCDLTLDASVSAGATTLIATLAGWPVGNEALPTSGLLIVGSGQDKEIVAYTNLVWAQDKATLTTAALHRDHVALSPVSIQVQDSTSLSLDNGDMISDAGFISSVSGGLSDLEGSRVTMWVEALQVNDGAVGVSGKLVQNTSLVLGPENVGDIVTIWHSDGGKTAADGALTHVGSVGHLSSATTTFLASDVGKVIKIDTAYRRIATMVGDHEITYDGAYLPDATDVSFTAFLPLPRTIVALDPVTKDFWVDGADLATGTGLPLILHRPVTRDFVSDPANVDEKIRYSGVAVSSDTGHGLWVPFRVWDADCTFEVLPAYEVLATYRALDISAAGTELAVSQASDLASLAQVTKHNPLVWAAQSALTAMGTTDRSIIMIPIDLYGVNKTGYPEDRTETAGYLAAIEAMELDKRLYYLVPLTRNTSVRDAFAAHCLAMSDPDEKKERVCYLTYDFPLGDLDSNTGVIAPGLDGGNAVITDAGQEFVSQYRVAPGQTVVIQKPAAYAGTYVVGQGTTDDTLVLDHANWDMTGEFADTDATINGDKTITGSVNDLWKPVEAGDYLKFGNITRKITSVTGTHFLTLAYEGNQITETGSGKTISILRTSPGIQYHVRPLSRDACALRLKGISQARASRRVVHMWPDSVEMITGTDALGNEVREFVSSIYAAAAEAGRDYVIPVQRSSTGSALAGITALEHSNFYFKKSQLNTIAEGGWAILEQPTLGGPVVMRHLLTTDMSAVKNQELAFTKNVDNMAKVMRESLEPSLNDDKGRVNITTDFLTALAFPVQGINETFVAAEQLVRTEGKQPYKIISITQDPYARDTILIREEMNVPIPANKVTVTLVI